MRAPVRVALGCISLVLCLLELPAGRCLPLPAPRQPDRRAPPDRRPSPALLLVRHAGPRPPVPPQPDGPQHRLRLLSPRHRLLALRHGAQHAARLSPQAPVPRGRRHAAGHLVRVGCVLGTCQVQNLSHRLWQLMGQSGRQDSSPMNPNSPHSYG